MNANEEWVFVRRKKSIEDLQYKEDTFFVWDLAFTGLWLNNSSVVLFLKEETVYKIMCFGDFLKVDWTVVWITVKWYVHDIRRAKTTRSAFHLQRNFYIKFLICLCVYLFFANVFMTFFLS